MSRQVTAAFSDRNAAALAVDALAQHGFSSADISLLMTDITRAIDAADDSGILLGVYAHEARVRLVKNILRKSGGEHVSAG